MSDTEFTPGPWFVVGYGRIIRSSESGYAGETICVFDANRGETLYANHKANAHLIAAAPEMYAAIQYLLKVRDVSCLHVDPAPDDLCARCRLDAVLAKAVQA